MNSQPLHTGLGLRRGLLPELLAMPASSVDFLECAPENWIGVGGVYGQGLAQLAERFAIACHGLSLSLGGTAPLDVAFLARTRQFLDRYQVRLYSEHLSYCSDDGHLYDLMPIPFTDEAVRHVAARIRQAQDLLGRRIAVRTSAITPRLPGHERAAVYPRGARRGRLRLAAGRQQRLRQCLQSSL
jgi:uncharacterized protein (UPF0276 family)